MEVYLVEKLKHLISLRSNLITVVIVLTGGVFSMLFVSIPPVIFYLLLVLGGYFDILFLLNLVNTHQDINKTLQILERAQNVS